MSNKRVNPFKLKLHLLECEADEKDKKISDLETKLKESEKLTKRLQQIVDKLRDKEFAGETLVNAVNSVYEPLYQGKCNEIEELKQQLEEKDKEKFKSMYFNKCLDFEHLHEEFVDKCNEFELKEYDYKQTIFEKNQDKISFAIEQLEKVKDWCKEYRTEDEFGVFTINVDDELNTEDNLLNFIDNQIVSLKKGVE